ncbi:MAG: DUF4347 domain-containing protein [Elainellaceae cyanobacterium]
MHVNSSAGAAFAPSSASKPQFNAAASALVVIDSRLTNAETLLQGIRPGATVLKIDAGDSLQKVSRTIESMGALEELHLVSHGSPGCLHLGNTELSLDTLPLQAAQISQWFKPARWASAPTMFIYGCNVAAGDAGSEFISKLHRLTGAAIAASTTRTGHRDLGGDWTLDAVVGHNGRRPLPKLAFTKNAMANYAGVMVSLNFQGPVGVDGASRFDIEDGDTFRFSNVVVGGAPQPIDALLTVVSQNNGAGIVRLDDDTDNPTAFRPFISAGGTESQPEASIDFSVQFVDAGTTTPAQVAEFVATLSDVDGTSGGGQPRREFYALSGFQAFTVLGSDDPNTGTLITAVPSATVANATRFFGPAASFDEFEDDARTQINTRIAASAEYINSNVFNFRLGITNPNGATGDISRQFSVNFDESLADQFNPPEVVPSDNLPPTAVPDTANTVIDTPIIIDVVANDTDPEDGGRPSGGVTQIEGIGVAVNQPIALPSGGTATLLQNGQISYVPPAGFTGADPFTYTVADSSGLTQNAGVTVTVVDDATNTPPTVIDDFASTPIDTPITVDVLANDTDTEDGGRPAGGITQINGTPVEPGQPITLPSGGVVTLLPTGGISYTPPVGFTGVEPFSYTTVDSGGAAQIGNVSITVTPPADPNDSDGDGILNINDLDDDNDGITDVDELGGNPNLDTDGDGIIDSLDLDADNDGILDVIEAGHDQADTNGDGRLDGPFGPNGLADVVETAPESGVINYTVFDTDGDGVRDFQDLDADNDGITDVTEGGGIDGGEFDPDGNGIVGDGPLIDSDGDGILDAADPDSGNALPVPDTDGDGARNFRDLDSDSDGLIDLVERGGDLPDADGDGRVDGPDPDGDGIVAVVDGAEGSFGTGPFPIPEPADPNGNGVPEYLEPPFDPNDADGDGIPNAEDLDDDNDGITDVDELGGNPNLDTDGDGIIDSLDLDADNDGIPDVIESGHDQEDTDGRGRLAGPFGPNGLADVVETAPESGVINYTVADTDGDGVRDFQDLDADNDGILDVIEAGHDGRDANGDGRLNGPFGPNGLANAVETAPGSDIINYTVIDTDGDGIRDFRDLDTDNDGITDVTEGGGTDPDGNGIVGNGPLVDSDGDGILDAADPDSGNALPVPDTDGDGARNFRDLDSDNDGINDLVERGGDLPDADGDGRVDGPDPDGDGIVAVVDGAEGTFGTGPFPIPDPADPNGNGVPEYIEPPAGGQGTGENDVIVGDAGDNILNGFSDPDQLSGLGGDDLLNGGSDDDLLDGGAGDDLLNGGSGRDRLLGKGGNDFINGGSNSDTILGGRGDDVLNGGRGADRIRGNGGRDQINGGGGRDRLLGNGGRDEVHGNRGADRILGGGARDILTGGQGRDTFGYRNANDFGDVITDFSILADRMDLRAVGVSSLDDVALVQRNANTVVRAQVDGSTQRIALLEDVQAFTLSEDNFMFS